MAISVSSRLIVENRKAFVARDNLAAVWNIYFLLDFLSVGRDNTGSGGGTALLPSKSKYVASPAGTRVAVCEVIEISLFYTPCTYNVCLGVFRRWKCWLQFTPRNSAL